MNNLVYRSEKTGDEKYVKQIALLRTNQSGEEI
jgi:hypothetical protein